MAKHRHSARSAVVAAIVTGFFGCALPYVTAEDPPAPPPDASTQVDADTRDATPIEVDARLPVLPVEPFPTSSGVDGSTWKDNTFATLGAAVAVGGRMIEVATSDDRFSVAVGDVLLLWTTLGLAPTDLTSPFVYPTVTPVGTFELVRVESISDVGLRIERGTLRGYPAGTTQVVRVPQYTDLVIPKDTTRSARAWDGKVGGIVAFLAQGKVTIAGTLTARGAGFPGGTAILNPGNPSTGCTATGTDSPAHSAKGFGIVVGGARAGVPALANAGGGGACLNAGGGGGSGVSRGGNGGLSWAGDGARDVGGRGGEALPNDPFGHLFLGGGGGAGEQDDPPPEGGTLGGHGGRGGGVVLVAASEVDAPGSLDASGLSAVSGIVSGGGGGGGGGIVAIRAERSIVCNRATSAGGAGGSTGHEVGTGGGGSGGGVWLLSPRVSCPTGVAGGAPGTYSGNTRSAQAGSDGKVVLAEP